MANLSDDKICFFESGRAVLVLCVLKDTPFYRMVLCILEDIPFYLMVTDSGCKQKSVASAPCSQVTMALCELRSLTAAPLKSVDGPFLLTSHDDIIFVEIINNSP